MEVIGVGMGRTGTLSLKHALERLGFAPCYHMVEIQREPERGSAWLDATRGEPVDWERVFHGYRATVDFPGRSFWRELTAHYPQAKVVLTVRDPRQWYDSAMATIYNPANAPEPGPIDQVWRLRFRHDFGCEPRDADRVIAGFRAHTAAVQGAVPAGRLLTYEVGQGWEPLCAFLGVPVPAEPFPHLNDRTSYPPPGSAGFPAW
ncbi:sulfotransferase family protein [Actinomadura sp. ATCC 31491]|uniref:Sulfotransferase family protein n=1 Tax=Actinomadura luzonensis TaxID=2805427 RepID=A0ABT0G1M9_9ACTN|nr:sulfotransferase family protein [Actinomadura luzonensis]MCK2218452.1 sulfotransferase family protein [Actinomadura luzonensis]